MERGAHDGALGTGRLETVMTEAGELEKDQWVDFDKLVDNSFAQKAMEAQ